MAGIAILRAYLSRLFGVGNISVGPNWPCNGDWGRAVAVLVFFLLAVALTQFTVRTIGVLLPHVGQVTPFRQRASIMSAWQRSESTKYWIASISVLGAAILVSMGGSALMNLAEMGNRTRPRETVSFGVTLFREIH